MISPGAMTREELDAYVLTWVKANANNPSGLIAYARSSVLDNREMRNLVRKLMEETKR